MPQSIDIAITNLTSVPVLVFILGFLAARTIADVSIPDAIYQFLSIYLLFGIGLKGGHALKHVTFSEILRPSLMTFGSSPYPSLQSLNSAMSRLFHRNLEQVLRKSYDTYYALS